jgi:hypothetical protein
LTDGLAKIDAEILAYIVSSIKGSKDGLCKIEDCRKKGEMAGLESANGQVWKFRV